MGWWVAKPNLRDAESVVWTSTANRLQGKQRYVGGRLSLTQDRLLFVPNRFDALTGGSRWSAAKTDVSDVVEAAREQGVPLTPAKAGASRRRMHVVLADGSDEYFVVNRVTEKVDQLRRLVGF